MSLVTRVRNTRRSSRSTGDASDGQATENRLAVPPRRRLRVDPERVSPVSSYDDEANNHTPPHAPRARGARPPPPRGARRPRPAPARRPPPPPPALLPSRSRPPPSPSRS